MKKYYKMTAYGCSMYGAIDSAFVVFFAVYSTFIQFAPWQLAAALGIAAVGVISMAIDYGLMRGLQTFFGRYYDGTQGTFKRLVMSWSLLFLTMQVFGTLGLTIYGRHYVTDAVTTVPELKKADVSTALQIADVNKGLNDQLSRLRSAEKRELAAAVVNPELSAMAKDGNNWAATQVNAKRKAVTDKYATERLKIEQQIATNLAAQQDATATAGRLAVAEYETKLGKYSTATTTLNSLQLWLSVASTVLLILSSLLYALEEVYAKGSAQTPDTTVFTGAQRSPFGFFTRPAGTGYRAPVRAEVAPTASIPTARPFSQNFSDQTKPAVSKMEIPAPTLELDPVVTAPVVRPEPAPRTPREVVWSGGEVAPSTPRAVDVATFGIFDCHIPLGSPSQVAYSTKTNGLPTRSVYEIEALRKQLRAYWSDLDRANRGEPIKRSIATAVRAIERIESILHAAGVQTRTRSRLAGANPKNPKP
jgi:hypothetical protein